MSREIDNTGKIIVCDKVIETSQRTTEADMSSDLSTLNGTFGFSVGQKQFSKDFSMSLSGSPNVSDSVPASLRVDIYRNGTRLDISNPIIKGSSLLWESMDGKFMKFGEYTETFMQEIGVGDLEKNREKFKVTWTTKDADSVPLTAAIDVSIREKVQYALSRYIDQSKVAEDAVVWFDTMEGALGVSHPYSCYLWTRSSSYYDFTNKCYVDWKYFKGDLYYEGQSVDDTVDDMAGKLNKYIEFTSSTDRFTVDKRSNGSDTVRMGVKINGYSNVSFKWSADIQLTPDGQENNQEIAFVVPHDNDYQSITVEVEVSYIEGEETKVVTHQFNLFPIDITKPEMYLGVLDSIPDGDYITSLQKKVMTGDWFLLSSTNELYTWNGSAWVCINGDSVTGTTFKDLEKVSVALVDMIKIGTNNKTTATILGVFKMLCADNGFIKFLKTWALFCGSGSETSGFYCRIADHDPATGESLANPVFIVKYNGNTVFQIDPASGNVFLGKPHEGLNTPESGFMYNALTKRISSKDDNVIIYEDGTISLKGYFSSKSIRNVKVDRTLKEFTDFSSFDSIVSCLVNLNCTDDKKYEAEGEIIYNGTSYQIDHISFGVLPKYNLFPNWSQQTYVEKILDGHNQKNIGRATIAQAVITFYSGENTWFIHQRKIHINGSSYIRMSEDKPWEFQLGIEEYYPLPKGIVEYSNFKVSGANEYDGHQFKLSDYPDFTVTISDFDKYQPSADDSFTIVSLYKVEDFKEALFIDNLPNFEPADENRIWRDSDGYLRISMKKEEQ